MGFKNNQIQYWLDELGLKCGERLTRDTKRSRILQAGEDISFLLSADRSNKAYALSVNLADSLRVSHYLLKKHPTETWF